MVKKQVSREGSVDNLALLQINGVQISLCSLMSDEGIGSRSQVDGLELIIHFITVSTSTSENYENLGISFIGGSYKGKSLSDVRILSTLSKQKLGKSFASLFESTGINPCFYKDLFRSVKVVFIQVTNSVKFRPCFR